MGYNRQETRAFWELIAFVACLGVTADFLWDNLEIATYVVGCVMLAGVVWVFVMAALLPANKTYQGSPTPGKAK